MFAPLVEAIEKFVTDFTPRRFLTWISVFVLLASVVMTFEWWTAHFRLNRIERQITQLERLEDVRTHRAMRQDTALGRLYAQLRDELEETVAEAGATPATIISSLMCKCQGFLPSPNVASRRHLSTSVYEMPRMST